MTSKTAVLVLCAAAACHGDIQSQCKSFFAAMPQECLVAANGRVDGCKAECVTSALTIRTDTANYTDCYNMFPCSDNAQVESMISFANCPTQKCVNVSETCNGTSPAVPQKEEQRPFYNDVSYKCADASGNIEIALPCIAEGVKKYYEVSINNVPGFEYIVYSKSGAKVGLQEMFGISDLDNDEVMDCFPKDTLDTTNCASGLISRGIRIQRPNTFKDETTPLPIRFGFKGCAGGSSCDNVLVFKTVGVAGTAGTLKAACTSPLKEATPADAEWCVLGGGSVLAVHPAVLLLSVLAVFVSL